MERAALLQLGREVLLAKLREKSDKLRNAIFLVHVHTPIQQYRVYNFN